MEACESLHFYRGSDSWVREGRVFPWFSGFEKAVDKKRMRLQRELAVHNSSVKQLRAPTTFGRKNAHYRL